MPFSGCTCSLGQALLLPLEAMEEALRAHLPQGKQNLVDANIQVLRHGYAVLSPAA